MSAFQATGRTIREVKVPVTGPTGKVVWVKRSTGTRDPNLARKMTAMIDTLGPTGHRAFDVLNRIRDRTLTVPQLWDLWITNGKDVAKVRAILADANLLEKRTAWLANVLQRANQGTADYYARVLRVLVRGIGVNGTLPRSAVTTEALQTWLDGLARQSGAQLSPGTKRKYHAALSSFFGYCVGVAHVMERNPMRAVKAPSKEKARSRHLTAAEAKALADAQPSPYRELSALLTGSGVEVGLALRLRVKDVNVTTREITAQGGKQRKGKTHRDRVAPVAGWAWSYVERAIQGKLPDALLFDTIPRMDIAREHHVAACEALGITDYTMRDGRHTYAVRLVKVGTPTMQVGKLLGHVDGAMVSTVYGQYEPTEAERARWERIAAERDAADADTTTEGRR